MTSKCGRIAIIGKPNVGKSTLLNHLVQQKISITTRKSQTTQSNIFGIRTCGDAQLIFVDTPGLHLKRPRKINARMNKCAQRSVVDCELVIFMVDRAHFNDNDEFALSLVKSCQKPTVLVVNKIDRHHDKVATAELISRLQDEHPFVAVHRLSAFNKHHVHTLEKTLIEHLPENEHAYQEDTLTTQDEPFMICELIRESLIDSVYDELPYETSIELFHRQDKEDAVTIDANIWVERAVQKPIIIGHRASKIKHISMKSREKIERLLEKKVHLRLWVKHKD